MEFSFQAEIEQLPIKLNIWKEANLTWEHQSCFINLIYDNPKVFLLHDENLSYCNYLNHTITKTVEKHVYLPHCMVARQLQGRVCKYLDTWLCQGIIQPSQSLYASQVVIMCKKLGEIHLGIDYCKLNYIMVRDVFPFPIIDEAILAVDRSNGFSSFDLTQGYLQ